MKRQSAATVVALLVFVLAGAGLTLTRHEPRAPLPTAGAVRAALGNPILARYLRGSGWDSARADPVDSQFDRVTFLAGGRVVAEAEVDSRGAVTRPVDFGTMTVPYGAWLAYEPEVLLGLSLLFVLMTAVAPWRRLRNLDVLAALSLLAPAIVLRARFVDASVLAGLPGLLYLMGRCVSLGLRTPPRRPSETTPLWTLATAGLGPEGRVRVLRWLALMLGLIFAMVAVSSNGAVDVIFAVMEGATKLVHGVLPYGHLPGDVVHGDTYPILSYAFYIPLALLAPVSSTWDSVDLALGFAALVALASGLAVALSTRQGRRPRTRHAADEEAALRAALAWLAFPLLLITVSTGTTDVMLAVLVVLAVLTWARPGLSAGLLATGAWFKLAPAALLPLALAPLRRRRLTSACAAVTGVSAAVLALVVGVGGIGGLSSMAHAVAFQFSRGSPQSVWAALSIRALQPFGQAAVLALIAAAALRLRAEPGIAGDRPRVAALAAAVLIGMQLSAYYWAFLYVVWVAPLLCLSVFSACEPVAEPVAEVLDPPLRAAQPALA